MNTSTAANVQRLAAMLGKRDWFMDALDAARTLHLDAWCIGAGTIRNIVWDSLHGHAHDTPPRDVDLVFFDMDDLSAAREDLLHARLSMLMPGIPWEVKNQARVHQWFEKHFGHAVAPLLSLEDAIASWPEYATAVGVWLDMEDTMRIIAPYGLDDLFAMRIRRNPARVSVETYRQRIAEKDYAARWPDVTIEHC